MPYNILYSYYVSLYPFNINMTTDNCFPTEAAARPAEPPRLNKELGYKMGKVNLSMTAVRQILMNSQGRGRKTNSNSPTKVLSLSALTWYLWLLQDEGKLIQEIEAACSKFDSSSSGLMSEIDVVNILSSANISCKHDKENLNKVPICVTRVTSSIYRLFRFAQTCPETELAKWELMNFSTCLF